MDCGHLLKLIFSWKAKFCFCTEKSVIYIKLFLITGQCCHFIYFEGSSTSFLPHLTESMTIPGTCLALVKGFLIIFSTSFLGLHSSPKVQAVQIHKCLRKMFKKMSKRTISGKINKETREQTFQQTALQKLQPHKSIEKKKHIHNKNLQYYRLIQLHFQ